MTTTKADKVILGEGAIYSTDSEVTCINNNVLVVGGSGSGKTMSIVESRLLQTVNSSLIVTVTKRRIVNLYKQFFQDKGYIVHDLNFINPKESDIAYDPLHYVNSYQDISFLAESVVWGNSKKSTNIDPYWNHAATSLLSALISYTMMRDSKASFADVLDLVDNLTIQTGCDHINTSLDEKFDRLAAREPNCFAVSCWRSFSQLPGKTAGCVFGTLNTELNTIFTPDLRKMLRLNQKLDFNELGNKRTVLFVSTSAVNPALHRFVNIFYGQAFKSLFEHSERYGKLAVPVHVLCDDFSIGSRINNFPMYISVFREAGVSVIMLIQSESQLVSIYGENDAISIIDNCDSYLFLGGVDIRTCKSVSLRMNIPLDEVLTLPIGYGYLFRRGQKPMKIRRYDIKNDKLYQFVISKYGKQPTGEKPR